MGFFWEGRPRRPWTPRANDPETPNVSQRYGVGGSVGMHAGDERDLWMMILGTSDVATVGDTRRRRRDVDALTS